jgi:hypothetical protein
LNNNRSLQAARVKIYSTSGTQKFIEEQGAEVIPGRIDLHLLPFWWSGWGFHQKYLAEYCIEGNNEI